MDVEGHYDRQANAVHSGRSVGYCLKLWSRFIRARDGNRCVDCHSRNSLAAHHICRKSFLEDFRFDPGNGITLCPDCHRELHAGLNRAPDFDEPVDAEGGEKLDLMERLFYMLVDDACDRGVLNDKHYALNESFLRALRKMQGLARDRTFAGCGAWQAYQIIATPPQGILVAIIRANLFE